MSTTGHIIICSTSYHEYDRRLQRISQSLAAAGYAVSWISRSLEESSKKSQSENINHHIIQTRFKSGPLFYLEYNWRIRNQLQSMEKNIVCAVDLDTVIGVSWAERGTGAKLVFDAHEIYYEVPELTGKPLKKSIWKSIAKRYLPRIKAAYTVNHSLKLHHQKYSNDYQVIRNVPPLSSSTPAVKQNNKILVYLGVLNAGRGVELYIDAMKQLPEYKLMIIGEGDLSEELRKRAADHASITFCGYRKPDEIFDLLGEASIGLNMLRAESLNYKLSLANKFFDYMHAGLPSINMDYPEYSQIISKDRVGLLTKAYTIESLVSAVRSLENASLYKELSENAISAREEYNWEKEEQKLLSFYSQS